MCVQLVAKGSTFLLAENKDSDQTAQTDLRKCQPVSKSKAIGTKSTAFLTQCVSRLSFHGLQEWLDTGYFVFRIGATLYILTFFRVQG